MTETAQLAAHLLGKLRRIVHVPLRVADAAIALARPFNANAAGPGDPDVATTGPGKGDEHQRAAQRAIDPGPEQSSDSGVPGTSSWRCSARGRRPWTCTNGQNVLHAESEPILRDAVRKLAP